MPYDFPAGCPSCCGYGIRPYVTDVRCSMIGWEHVIDADELWGTDAYQYETYVLDYANRHYAFLQGRICRECGGTGRREVWNDIAPTLLPSLEASIFRSRATSRETRKEDRKFWLRAACYAEEFLRLQRQLQAAREELEERGAGGS